MICTSWDHGQLKGPAPIVCESVSPYMERQRTVHIGEADANLIANAPEDIQWLIDELERVSKTDGGICIICGQYYSGDDCKRCSPEQKGTQDV